jgi:hypothetical protein
MIQALSVDVIGASTAYLALTSETKLIAEHPLLGWIAAATRVAHQVTRPANVILPFVDTVWKSLFLRSVSASCYARIFIDDHARIKPV